MVLFKDGSGIGNAKRNHVSTDIKCSPKMSVSFCEFAGAVHVLNMTGTWTVKKTNHSRSSFRLQIDLVAAILDDLAPRWIGRIRKETLDDVKDA